MGKREDIIIGFSKPKAWFVPFSWIIRALYRTKYSHTYVRWYAKGAQADVYYEASGSSVSFIGGEIFKKKTEVIHEYKISITKEQRQELVRWCLNNSGVDYGLMQAIGLGFVEIFKLDKNPFSDKKGQICSEVVAHILKEVADLGITIDFEKATPKDIKNFLDSIPQIAQKIL